MSQTSLAGYTSPITPCFFSTMVSRWSFAVVLAATALVALSAIPTAHAGAVFEIREAIVPSDDAYKFKFSDVTPGLTELGAVVRSGKEGAGAIFNTSIIPLNLVTFKQCVALAPHIHPNGAETVFVVKGKVRMQVFRGEGDNALHTIELGEREAGYIPQGSIHFVENAYDGESTFLQLFDHPFAGANFIANAMLTLPTSAVNAAFSKDIIDPDYKPTANSPLIKIRDCEFKGY